MKRSEFHMMRFSWLALMLLACSTSWAERVSIPGANASFEPPEGFTALSSEELAIKFPSETAPKTVVGDERRKTTVAYEMRKFALTEQELPGLLTAIADAMNRAHPGIQWKKREIVEMAGQKWIWLEMTSTAIDTDIYNIILMTPRNGKALAFALNSTKDLFPIQEAALRKSIASIVLNGNTQGAIVR